MRDVAEISREPSDVRFGEMSGSLGFLLRLSQLEAFRDYFDHLGELELRPGEMSVLLLLDLNPGVRQGVLARRLMIKRAHMTKMVRAMEAGGLVTRTVPDDDRRSIELWLTAAGRRKVEAIRTPILAYEDGTDGRLSRTETAQLKQLLRKYLGLAEETGARL